MEAGGGGSTVGEFHQSYGGENYGKHASSKCALSRICIQKHESNYLDHGHSECIQNELNDVHFLIDRAMLPVTFSHDMCGIVCRVRACLVYFRQS